MAAVNKNIVITGFMGTGKSAVGRRLAKELSFRFFDTDELIEKDAGMSVKEIFGKSGEGHFRVLERGIIKAITEGKLGDGVVLSTGGGAVADDENREALKRWGTVVCLTASVDVILGRVGDKDERPLLNVGERREKIQGLLAERGPAYEDSHLMIDTTSRSVEEVVEEIKVFLSQPG